MKINSFFLISIIILALTINCKKRDDFPTNNIPSNTTAKYKELALLKGDTIAYNSLSRDYMDSPYEGFLYTALIMANKHNYHLAFEDTYYCLTDYSHKAEFTELENLDEKTKSMALEYLKLGAERGNKECKKLLGHYYIEGKYLEKDIIKGKKLIDEGEK